MGRLVGSRGSSWSVSERSSWATWVLIILGIDLGSEKDAPRGAFWEPKWNQNRTKIEVENEDEKKTLLGAPWIDFGSFWEATWGEKSSKFIGGASIS